MGSFYLHESQPGLCHKCHPRCGTPCILRPDGLKAVSKFAYITYIGTPPGAITVATLIGKNIKKKKNCNLSYTKYVITPFISERVKKCSSHALCTHHFQGWISLI